MMHLTDTTLYHWEGNSLERYEIQAFWQETTGVTPSAQGDKTNSETEVFIPFSEYEGRLDTGDYLVRGICPYVYNGTVKPLVQEYKAKSILRLTMCDYGSPDMQHWEVSAR